MGNIIARPCTSSGKNNIVQKDKVKKNVSRCKDYNVNDDDRETFSLEPSSEGEKLPSTESPKKKSGLRETYKGVGLNNLGNTCYANSVLQALHATVEFRLKCISYTQHYQPQTEDENNLLANLGDLFTSMETAYASNTKAFSPKTFIQTVRDHNEMFRNHSQHDAHEFFNYLINEIAESVKKDEKIKKNSSNHDDGEEEKLTWVQSLFEGIINYETRCLCCETLTRRSEPFMDLSVDVIENSTLRRCIQRFLTSELLKHQDKYFCDQCASLQEAIRFTKFGRLPQVLVIHLKRFEFFGGRISAGRNNQSNGRFNKISSKVSFPLSMNLENHEDNPCSFKYTLSAIVIHIGTNMTFGHYIACVRENHHWFILDDSNIDEIDKAKLSCFYGASSTRTTGTENSSSPHKCGYILFYKKVNPSTKSPDSSGDKTPPTSNNSSFFSTCDELKQKKKLRPWRLSESPKNTETPLIKGTR